MFMIGSEETSRLKMFIQVEPAYYVASVNLSSSLKLWSGNCQKSIRLLWF